MPLAEGHVSLLCCRFHFGQQRAEFLDAPNMIADSGFHAGVTRSVEIKLIHYQETLLLGAERGPQINRRRTGKDDAAGGDGIQIGGGRSH